MSLPATIQTEQQPDAPPRRPIAVVATERPDWSWSFRPAVPEALRPRLADLAAEIADAIGMRAEVAALPWWAVDAEQELRAARQEGLAALARADAAALGYRLAVVPAVGRLREREVIA